MFKAFGIGLDANDKYRRAYDKGVLLGDFEAAVRQFGEAALEFEKHGQTEGQCRALANSYLYEYLRTGKGDLLKPLISLLQPLPQIECIGSATEFMPSPPLVAELQARLTEEDLLALDSQADAETYATAHERARDRFAPIRSQRLLTYAYSSPDQFRETAESRYFLHSGKASWYRGMAKATIDPPAAADEFGRSVLAFRRAGHTRGEEQAARQLDNLRLTRTCWVCGREMQGLGIHYTYLPSTVYPYQMTVLAQSKQDLGTVRAAESEVAVCIVCKELIVKQARRIADDQVAQLVEQVVNPLVARVDQLAALVANLVQNAHQH